MANLTDDNWQQTSKISVQMSPIETFKIISPLLGNPLLWCTNQWRSNYYKQWIYRFIRTRWSRFADKGFPGIQSTIDEKGAGVVLVMTLFLRGGMFFEEEVKETYQVAKFRIHIERIMQRLRIYNILVKLPMNLLPHADNIVFMCCVLVNLKQLILKELSDSEDAEET